MLSLFMAKWGGTYLKLKQVRSQDSMRTKLFVARARKLDIFWIFISLNDTGTCFIEFALVGWACPAHSRKDLSAQARMRIF